MAVVLSRVHELEPSRFEVAHIEPIEDPLDALPHYLSDDGLGDTIRSLLAERTMQNCNEICLLHGDYWPGNLMVDNRRIVAVLDWEDAKVGDPLADLACAGVELACDGGRFAVDRFTDRYCESRPGVSLDDLAIWDMYVSATALSGMHLEPFGAGRSQTTLDDQRLLRRCSSAPRKPSVIAGP